MKRRAATVIAFALAVCAVSSARAADDGADYLVLGPRQLLVLRLHVMVDGRPAAVARNWYWDRLFADLDRDGDGFLSKAEVARAPSVSFLRCFFDGGPAADATDNIAPFAALDTDRDGRVSRREFDAYYRTAFDAFRLVNLPPDHNATALTEVLFALLDRDGDGKLSRAELKRAAELLRRVDFNDDEWITPYELLLTRRDANQPVFVQPASILSRANSSEEAWRSAALQNYRIEVPVLLSLWGRVPDVELTVRLKTEQVASEPAKEPARVEVFKPMRRAMPFAEKARATPDGMRIALNAFELDIDAADESETNLQGLHQFLRQQFQAAAADGKKALTRQQATEVELLAGLFVLADRNGDGVLTEGELDAFLELHAAGAVCFTTVTLTDRSPGLFGLLDADGDARLSLRELATAADRLLGPDRETLSRDELTRRWQLRLTQGKPASARAAARAEAKAPAARGPIWFRKMDRNGDGYISPREWLGPVDLFRQLDADGDGLLSPEEAAAADNHAQPPINSR